jgi:hypothetical protein
MKNLIAAESLTGEYGHVEPGDKFEVRNELADYLIGKGYATEDTDAPSADMAEGAEADDDTDPDKKDDKGAAGRQTKTDKTVTTGNLQ